MKFFFPDSQDFVDPSFDFLTETRSPDRVVQRDDKYAHELFPDPPFDGLLVSKAAVDPDHASGSRYTMAQQQRFRSEGARRYFRLDAIKTKRLALMGDCGAFSYISEPRPPVTVEKVTDFYENAGVDYGVSVDHVILGFDPGLDQQQMTLDGFAQPGAPRERQAITLELAADFLRVCRARRLVFEPIGVAQGWSPLSYAKAVDQLQLMGYGYIGLGGMVGLKTVEVLACLKAVGDIRKRETRLHLFGITRLAHLESFTSYGVASFDSTSPLKKAFKDDTDNYFTSLEEAYAAIRVPQADANPKLQKRIQAGLLDQRTAKDLESRCLRLLRLFDRDEADIDETLEALEHYGKVFDETSNWAERYRRTLSDRPWKNCPCEVCKDFRAKGLGIDVVLFRGAERNRRRGFHNLFVLYTTLQHRLMRTSRDAVLVPADSSSGQKGGHL